ncbi:MAG: hypothetical protein H0X36_13910 [Sphingomonadaceae bacterium]|nr:hypothetical protein [Sphingomonadaceae bacterium]
MAAAAAISGVFPAHAQDTPDIVVTGRGLDAPPGERAYDVVMLHSDRPAQSASGRLDALRDVAGLAQFRRSDALGEVRHQQ